MFVLASLVGMVIGCPSTNTPSCTEPNLMGLRCDQRYVGLSPEDVRLYCAVRQRGFEEAGFGTTATCGTMSIDFSVNTCVRQLSAPSSIFEPRNPRCPGTVGDGVRCWRAWATELAAQRDRGETCTAWPSIPDCDYRRREPQSEWQFCDPRMNPDAGASTVDAGP